MMVDELHDKKFMVSIGQRVTNPAKAIPLGDVTLVSHESALRPEMGPDASFWEWMRKTMREDQERYADPPLCAGARIVVDENGEGVLTIDESLPDGVWLVTRAGKTLRYEGVTGPVRAESHAERAEDVEVSPVALTFETRKP